MGKRGRKQILDLVLEDNLIKKCNGIVSSDLQQEKYGIGGNRKTLVRKAGGCEVQRGWAMKIGINIHRKKINSTWNEWSIGYIDITLRDLPDLSCLDGTGSCLWNLDFCEGQETK